jgi:hypothetical protein
MDQDKDSLVGALRYLGAKHDATVEDIDALYFRSITYWCGPKYPADPDFCHCQIKRIDEAYLVILKAILRQDSWKSDVSFTMEDVERRKDQYLQPGPVARREMLKLQPEKV